MVIFGAGASYDSAPAVRASDHGGVPDRPPLAKELFADRREFHDALLEFEEFHALVDRMRTLPEDLPLEQFLADLQAESTRFKHRPRQLLAIKFYLRRILTEVPYSWYQRHAGITNYAGLMSDLLDWQADTKEDVALVTFNYDMLLDRAFASALGFNPAASSSPDLDGYINHGPFSLFKPHGSVNWARVQENHREIDGISTLHHLIGHAGQLVPTDAFEISGNWDFWVSQTDTTSRWYRPWQFRSI